MDPDLFAAGVSAIGANLMPFDQANHVDKRPYMHEGACYAFCLAWICSQRRKVDNLPVVGKSQTMEDVSWLSEQKNRGSQKESTELFMRGNGLRPDGETGFKTVNWEKVWFFLSAQPAYYIVGAAPAGGSGHCLAFNTSNGAALMFDPNFGTVNFPDAATMKHFFSKFWPKAYPDLAHGVGAIVSRFV